MFKRKRHRQSHYVKQRQPASVPGQWHSWLRVITVNVVIAVLICVGYWLYLQVTNPRAMPFRQVTVIGDAQHIPPALLETTVLSHLQGGFFSLNVAQLKQGLLTLPWVFSVSIRRVWPSRLVINVAEQKPLAQWGAYAVMNQQGVIFYPEISSIPSNLPLLFGPEDSESRVVAEYQAFNQQISGLGLTVCRLIETPRLAWRLQLSNGIEVLLGRQNIDARFAQFVQLYAEIIGSHAKQVRRVDLRYPNGLAIQWRGKAPRLSR